MQGRNLLFTVTPSRLGSRYLDHAKRATLIGTGAAAAALAMPRVARGKDRPNVVFVSIDDLNDFPSPFGGYPGIVTPNFERLASMGTVFSNAFAHVPACGGARTAALLGVSAHKSGSYGNGQDWALSPALAGVPTLVGYLHESGWATHGAGKIYPKPARPEDWDSNVLADKASVQDAGHIRSATARARFADRGAEDSFDFGAGKHGGKADSETAARGVARLTDGSFSAGGQFVAVGFHRTHMPFVVARRFFDLYPLEPELPPGFFPGATAVEHNIEDWSDLPARAIRNVPSYIGRQIAEHDEYHELLRAYLASASFVDHLLGKLLDAYEAVRENAYLVLWSDHGWQLGEKLAFAKFTLWERALRVPFMVAGPGIGQQTIDEPVGMIDLYPTLCDLLGLPVPVHCDGKSLAPTLRSGERIEDAAAISFWSNGEPEPAFQVFRSIRTAKHRLIDYGAGQIELYDHESDPYEWTNIAGSVDGSLIRQLKRRMPETFAPPI